MVFLVRPSVLVLLSVLKVVQVGLPYLRAKAQDYFEALGGGVDHDLLDEDAQGRQAREKLKENEAKTEEITSTSEADTAFKEVKGPHIR